MLREGQVVVLKVGPQDERAVRKVEAGQKGTVIVSSKDTIWVLLMNGDIWTGAGGLVYPDQTEEKTDGAPTASDPTPAAD
jgi:hypothetical protein